MSDRPIDVVICYSNDDADTAESLREALKTEGLEVWAYSDNKDPRDYRETLGRVFAGRPVVVLVVSRATPDSAEVKWEIGQIQHMGLPLVPVFVTENVLRSDATRNLLGLAHANGVPLSRRAVDDDSLREIRERIGNANRERFSAGPRKIVGREREMRDVLHRLTVGNTTRLLLHGAPGVGKTATATACLAQLDQSRWRTGRVLLGKNDTTLAHVCERVAESLQLGVSGKVDSGVLSRELRVWLGGWPRGCLLIDNIEQIRGAESQRFWDWCASLQIPEISLLLTSRLPGGHASKLSLGPLAIAGTDARERMSAAQLRQVPAIQLFLTSLTEHRMAGDYSTAPPDSELTWLRTIGSVCEKLDGFPGAIEALAAWFASEQEIPGREDELREFREVLSQSDYAGESPETMALAVKTVHDLMGEREQRALLVAVSFGDGFSRRAGTLGDRIRKRLGVHAQDLDRLIQAGLLRPHRAEARRWSPLPSVLEAARELRPPERIGAFNDALAGEALIFAQAILERGDWSTEDIGERHTLIQAAGAAVAAGDAGTATPILQALAKLVTYASIATTVYEFTCDLLRSESGSKPGPEHFELCCLAASGARQLGRYDEAFEHAEHAVKDSPDARGLLRAHFLLENISEFRGRRSNLARLAPDVDRSLERDALVADSMKLERGGAVDWARSDGSETYRAHRDRALRLLDQAEAVAVGGLWWRWRIPMIRGVFYWRDAQFENALAQYRRAIETLPPNERKSAWYGGALTNQALAWIDQENFADAERSLLEGRPYLVENAAYYAVNLVGEILAQLFRGLDATGRLSASACEAALRLVDTHRQAIRDGEYLQNYAWLLSLEGEAAAALQRDDAESILREARTVCERAGIHSFERWFRVSTLLAEYALGRNDRESTRWFTAEAGRYLTCRQVTRHWPVRRTVLMKQRYDAIKRRLEELEE